MIMNQHSMASVKNQNELRVFGIRRTGNHGIISWIIDGYPGTVVHLNNVKKYHPDPYVSFGMVTVKNVSFWQCKPSVIGLMKHKLKRRKTAQFMSNDPKLRIDRIRNLIDKQCLIHSYENYRLNDKHFTLFDEQRKNYVGTSENRYEVLILRDSYNLFVSLLKSGMMNAKNKDYLVETYKQYAREFTNRTQLISGKLVCIKYNQWFMDKNYRQEIANKLGFETSGQAFTKVPSEGGGSSFDAREFNNQAHQQKVLERWKYFIGDSFYKDLFKDTELCELSDEIFGIVASEI